MFMGRKLSRKLYVAKIRNIVEQSEVPVRATGFDFRLSKARMIDLHQKECRRQLEVFTRVGCGIFLNGCSCAPARNAASCSTER